MRRTFHFQDLANDEFESLVGAVCLNILGTGTLVFAAGKDGGRDAAFNGCAQKFPSESSPLSGKFVIQAKHTNNPVGSCSDSEFARLLESEHPKILTLIKNGELEHYLVFTNRKKPADDGVKKEQILISLGLQTAHILGLEQLRSWLTEHPKVWSNLGFDRFDTPIRIQIDDLTTIITAFHSSLAEGFRPSPENFTFVPKPQKNKINKLSEPYFEEIRTRSLPYFKQIEDFLKNPRNIEFREMYDDTTDEIRRKITSSGETFGSFDDALTYIIDHVTLNNEALRRRRRFAAIFLHYMYYTCDIGQHADTIQAS